ncbi:pentatricopeptide repeat-containing protein At1g08070, chloroplastic [Magnolia sinica]|uniref:pentatricopeptide repeat-containing protein At1g08070, chloroplastic n=1 Tax=Magnolia sinica TaxID=86752 RepID=UPI00265A61E1|nr:pentatricopeptide repeat-containing protein At1g08070, chloroplastic [Magnolia sinica]
MGWVWVAKVLVHVLTRVGSSDGWSGCHTGITVGPTELFVARVPTRSAVRNSLPYISFLTVKCLAGNGTKPTTFQKSNNLISLSHTLSMAFASLPISSSSFSPLHFLPSSDPPYSILKTHPTLSLLSTSSKSLQTLKQIHSHFIKTGLHHSPFSLTKLLESCALTPDLLSYALLVFDSIQEPNHFIWNTIIRGLALGPSPITAVHFYIRMLLTGTHPNSYTFPFVLKACAQAAAAAREGKQVHAHVLKLGLESDAFVHTSMINMYARNGELDDAYQVFDLSSMRDPVSFTALVAGYFLCGYLDDAHQLFDKMPARDTVSWNAMISGYAQSGRFEEALDFFQEMLRSKVEPNESTMVSVLSSCAHTGSIELGNWVRSWIENHGLESNLRLVNAFIDMYAKCGDLETARAFFDGICRRDQISWNVMIGGYTLSSQYKEALALFREMQFSNQEPNDVTILSILPACTHLGALDLGKWIHAYIDKNMSNTANSALYTSLIVMYAKCGSIESAQQVFNAMEVKTLASWNAMISGLALHGHADKALALFSRMTDEEIQPDDITFVGILSACSHAGMVEMGRQCFNSMIQDYKISPKLHHYGCLIDLLGRARLFDEARALMNKMEMKPDGAIWGSLLAACRVHSNVELAEYVADHLLELEPENPGVYILLSNIYAGAGRWEDVAKIRTRLNDKGTKKEPGCTSIEVGSTVHEFLVGDRVHPQSDDIYEMLEEIDKLLELAGHVPDTSEISYDIEEWREGGMCHHSEKLAIAFGLISTSPGTTIRIVKNLRVCGNCHSEAKFISKIFNREIIARDRNRFHHFKDGVCSCMDYW